MDNELDQVENERQKQKKALTASGLSQMLPGLFNKSAAPEVIQGEQDPTDSMIPQNNKRQGAVDFSNQIKKQIEKEENSPLNILMKRFGLVKPANMDSLENSKNNLQADIQAREEMPFTAATEPISVESQDDINEIKRRILKNMVK